MEANQVIAKQFALQTNLFNNVLEGINEKEGLNRLSGKVNHLRWIAGHLVNARYNYAQMLGATTDQYPYAEIFTDKNTPPPNNKALDMEIDYPTLQDSQARWNKIASAFTNTVSNMPAEQGNSELPFGTPIGGKSMQEFLAFLTHHEAYHIGQMSIIRRDLGHDAMSYKQ